MNKLVKFRYICITTCVLLIILYFSNNSFIDFGSSEIFVPWKTSDNNHVDLNIITNQSFNCVKTKLLLNKYRTTVCVHEVNQDHDVSGLLVSSGIWEEHLVTRFLRILSIHKEYSFIDIGANLGVYTMYAASVGCSNIISIECFGPNIERIRRSIQLENVLKQVVLIPRALYNKSDAYLSLRANIQNNIGSQKLINEVSENEQDPFVVRTIRFDDLLPIFNQRNIAHAIIKIDIETSEHFLCQTGQLIFNQINIPFIMMEWATIKTLPSRANLILKFFLSRDYIPFNSETCQPQHQMDYRLWNTQDICWIKHNYAHLCQV